MAINIPIGVSAQFMGTGHVVVLREGKEFALEKGDIIYRNDVIKVIGDGDVKLLMIDGTFVDISGSFPFDCKDYLLLEKANPNNQAHDSHAAQIQAAAAATASIEMMHKLILHHVDPDKISDAMKHCMALESLQFPSENNESISQFATVRGMENSPNDNLISPSPDGSQDSVILPTADVGPLAAPGFVFVPPFADLSLTSTVDNANPSLGQELTFTYSLSNLGHATATGISVNESLPTGLDFISADPSIGQYNPATGDWTINSLSDGATATLTLHALPLIEAGIQNPFTSLPAEEAAWNSVNLYAFHTGTAYESDSGLLNIAGLPDADSSVAFTQLGFVPTPEQLGIGVSENLTSDISATVSGSEVTSNTMVVDFKTPVEAATIQLSDLFSGSFHLTQYAEITAYDAQGHEVGNFITGAVAPSSSLTSIPDTVFMPLHYAESPTTVGTYGTLTLSTPLDFQYLAFTALEAGNDSGQGSNYYIQALQALPDNVNPTATITGADQADPNLANNTTTTSALPQASPLADTPATYTISSSDILNYSHTEVQDLNTLLSNISAPAADKVMFVNGSANDHVDLTGATWTNAGQTHPANDAATGYNVYVSNSNTVALVSTEIPLAHVQHT